MQKNKQYWLLNAVCLTILASMVYAQHDSGKSLPAQITTDSNFCTEMVGYWKFDSGSGAVAYDTSNNTNNGDLINMSNEEWTEDVPPQIDFWDPSALNFPGNGYVRAATGSSLQVTGGLTIAMWVNYTLLSNNEDGNVLISYAGETKENGSEAEGDNYLYAFSINGANKKLRLMWENGSDSRDVITESSVAADISSGEWVHLVVSRNASRKEISFYVNGELLGATQEYTLLPSGNSGGVLAIGAGPHNLSQTYFQGAMDDIRFYDKPMPAAQVKDMYDGADDLMGCTCGNGEVEPPEECDDGNTDNSDACTNSCTAAVCGDGYLQEGEECEPPNTDSCSSTCTTITDEEEEETTAEEETQEVPPNCGNRVVEADEGEECDEGHLNGSGECSEYCTILYCGDGIVSPEVNEECEPTPVSYVNGEPVFEEPTCGEACSIPETNEDTGKVEGGCSRLFLPPCEEEQTTSSEASSVSVQNSVSSESSTGSLKTAAPEQTACGNTTLDTDEQCDDGGVCRGGSEDGSIVVSEEDLEACLDGGGVSEPVGNDGCSAECTEEFCGDGTVQPAGEDTVVGTIDDEQCDNGSVCSNNTDVSCVEDEDCTVEVSCLENEEGTMTCGGTADGTACSSDDECSQFGRCIYNYEANPNCTNACTLLSTSSSSSSAASSIQSTEGEPVCGNFIVEAGEECDDGNMNSDTVPDACRTDCTAPVCGDGVTDGSEQCDNGNNNSDTKSDTCRTDCKLPQCGDGVVDSGEECDGGPSCKADCTLPAISVCGNGIVEGNEKCDDGNTEPGDGCSPTCTIGPVLVSGTSQSSASTQTTSSSSSAAETSSIRSESSSSTKVAGVQSASSFQRSSATSRSIAVRVASSSVRSFYTLQPVQTTPVRRPPQQNPTASVVRQPTHSPVGDTGPAAIAVIASGAAGGVLWRRRKKRLSK